MYGPVTVMDCLKMLWWMMLHPEPAPPKRTYAEVKAETDKVLEKPIMVLHDSDHSYRQVRLTPTTAILCEMKGRKAALCEDHFPNEAPGPGFDRTEGMKLTRVQVLLVEPA